MRRILVQVVLLAAATAAAAPASGIAQTEQDSSTRKYSLLQDRLHLGMFPYRDPGHNVLREDWIDKSTFIPKRYVAERFVEDGKEHKGEAVPDL